MALLAYRSSLAEGDDGLDFMDESFTLTSEADKVFYDLSISHKYSYALFKVEGSFITADKTHPIIKPVPGQLANKQPFIHMRRELLRVKEPRFGLYTRDTKKGPQVVKFLFTSKSHKTSLKRRYDGATVDFLTDLPLLRIESESDLRFDTMNKPGTW